MSAPHCLDCGCQLPVAQHHLLPRPTRCVKCEVEHQRQIEAVKQIFRRA